MPKNPFYDSSKTHHTPHGFQYPEPIAFELQNVWKWRVQRSYNRYPHPPQGGYEAFSREWWQAAEFTFDNDAVWWLGHATLLFRIGQQTVLTDPQFSLRASPLSFVGPKRKTPLAATIDQLPHIDVIVISHHHYDHLDAPSIRALISRFPECQFLVPLGVKALVTSLGARYVSELDWWQDITLNGTLFTFVPAKHWSARGLTDRNRTLWGGWMFNRAGRNYYFMGDTGYSTLLHEIPRRLGPIDFAAIPIGAYAPRWFMQSQHIDPQQAVQLHQELGCRRSLAIHWGVFELADEPIDEPPRYLAEALKTQRLTPDSFSAIRMGDFLAL
ncbi:MAG: putative protein [Candidatus Erwinia impunctatus]|nr:putative protein [Culicoides impunctatus]